MMTCFYSAHDRLVWFTLVSCRKEQEEIREKRSTIAKTVHTRSVTLCDINIILLTACMIPVYSGNVGADVLVFAV